MSVDVHNHVVPSEVLELLRGDPSYGVTIVGDEWHGGHHVGFPVVPSFYDPAAKVADLDERAIDRAVVSCAPPVFLYDAPASRAEQLCEAANAGMAAFCRYRPERLAWLAQLPMQAPLRAAEIFAQAVASGAVGAAVGTSIAGLRLDEPAFEVFWDAADAISRPVLLHPAFNEPNAALDAYYLQNVIGNPLETTVAVERLICAGVLARHKGVRLVLVHGGGYLPYQLGRLAHACGVRKEIEISSGDVWADVAQLYFDTITHDRAALSYLVSKMGRDHVLLGTDMPFDMATPSPVKTLRATLDAAGFRAVAEANADRLFPFGAGAEAPAR